MDEELNKLLDEAFALGASESDIQQIIDSYKSKKKNTVQPIDGGGNSKVGTPSTSPSKSQSKSTSGGNKFALDPTNFLNKEEEEPLLPQPTKKVITPENLKAQKSFEDNLFGVSKYGNKTLRIDRGEIDNNGVDVVQEIEIDPRTIPVSPYKNVTDDVFLGTIRKKLLENQPLSQQEEVFIRKNQNPPSKFTADDDRLLQGLSGELGLAVDAIKDAKVPDLIGAIFPQIQGKTFGDIASSNEGKYSQIQIVKEKLKRDIELEESKRTGEKGETSDYETLAKLNSQLEDVTALEKKVSRSLATVAEDGEDALVRTDNSGSNWERFKKSIQNIGMASILRPNLDVSDVELKVNELPSQAITGLNYTKYAEPVEFERVTRALAQGKPISETQIANLTNIGIDIEKERLKEDYNQLKIDKPTFDAKKMELSVKAYDNLVGNKEVLRGFLSSNIAEVLDEMEVMKSEALTSEGKAMQKVFGMRWNYSDEEIDYAAQVVAKTNGLNVDDPRVKEAVQYLKDNEGAMIMQNSISKSGFTRDFFKGAAQPIRGIVSTIEGLGKTSEEIYAEGQSQGNVNVSETPVKRIANSWEGTVGKVFEGTGQLISQAGLAYLTGGAVGGAGRAILGRGGVAALEGDIALADMAASDLTGAGLYKGKDFVSTFVTTFASTYDGNLKQAQTYTADDGKAMAVAGGLSGVEALAENILSPLDIARGVSKTLFGKTPTQRIINILDDDKILNKSSAVKDFLEGTLKAGLASGRMVATEIAEEEITALADYGTNMILNPNSQSFKNRVLKEELFETGIQTGLSMAIPALLTGVGAFNTNSFAKGSLIIAAQNRQMMVDALDKNLADGAISQDQYNQKLQIVNSASKANEELPLKSDGSKLNSEQKADYIYSRVSEGALKRKIELSNDEAEKSILQNKIAEQQKFREEILKTTTNVQPQTTENVSPQTQNNEGAQGQVNETENAPNAQDAEIVIDEEGLGILNGLTPTEKLSDFDITMLKGSPKLAYEMIADQALGFGRVNGVRQPIPEAAAGTNEASVREKYGDAVVDKALQLFPLQINTQTNEQEKETNPNEVLGGVRQEGNQNEGGQVSEQLSKEETTLEIDRLRQEEQKELAAALPNIESYKVNGVVDKSLITDEGELATYNEIFDRYDAEITPLLNSQKFQNKSDADIEVRMSELEGSKSGTSEMDEFNSLEKEMEKRERATVFNVPLDKVSESVDALMQKEKDKPNGFGSFIENRDARETKEVADRYLNAKKLTDAEIKEDFKNSLFGNPTTWYADGLKLRESMNEAAIRGIDVNELLKTVEGEFTKDGFDEATARKVIANLLKPVFVGSQKVNEKQIAQQVNNETTPTVSEPLQQNEGATPQQGNQEAVQQGTNDVGQAGARTTTPVQPVVRRLNTGGEGLVTMTGLTEEERTERVEQRRKQTSVSEKVQEEQGLLDDVAAYEKLQGGNRGKTSPQGLAQLNRLRNKIADFNRKYKSKYRYDDRRGVLRGDTGKSVKRVAIDGEKAIVEGKGIMDRSAKTQKIFNDLFNTSATPTGYTANGIRMSASQLDGTIEDILDGIPSRRAINYLDALERQIENDDFDFSKADSPNQDFGRTRLSDVLGAEFEFVGGEITQEQIEAFLADESLNDFEFENILDDNIENLITENEQEGTTTTNEQPIPTTETKDSGQPKQDSKEGAKAKADNADAKPKPTPPLTKEKRIEDFNKKADAAANALIDFLTPKTTKGVNKSGLGVAEIVNGATSVIKATYAATQNIKEAIEAGVQYFSDNWDENELGELPIDAVREKLEADFEVPPTQTIQEVAEDVRNGKITYLEAIEGQTDKFIADLDKELYGGGFSFQEQAFREQIRKAKMSGLDETQATEFAASIKKLTKRQKEIISEVYLETAQTDKMAEELKEAFAQLAQGKQPKSVLERLAVSDVTALVSALKNALTYEAVSNAQLEKMADFIVDAIDLNAADQYLNAMVNGNVADVRQLVRAKLIIKLQAQGNNDLATSLINDMADEATLSGRQTQSLIKAYEILNAKGNPKTKAAFQKRYADAVQKAAREQNKEMARTITEQEVEIGKLNERLHRDTQKSSGMSKLKEIIAKLCGLRNK